MNISFFLKPKVEVSYLADDCPTDQAMQYMMDTGFTAIPMIDATGKYIGTVCEGDFLRYLLEKRPDNLSGLPVREIPRRFRHATVSIDADIVDLVDLVTEQNFVPVADGRGMFIGIVTRHDILAYLKQKC